MGLTVRSPAPPVAARMLRSGGAAEAGRMLEGLLAAIGERKTRFGLLQNHQGAVVEELCQVLAFLHSRPEPGVSTCRW
jgi:hypothetical protein